MTHILNLTPTLKINQLIQSLPKIQTNFNKSNFNQAFEVCCQQLEQTYPEWTAALFDRSFLTNEAAPLFKNGSIPSPLQLASAWREQFGVGQNREADIDTILPVAADFLDLLYLEINY